MDRGALLTLPNLVSMTRLVLAAGFLATREPITRIVLIATASASDFLDGWLARRRNAATKWGALLDPIADRAFVFAAVSSFLAHGEITTAEYFILLSRDLATAIGFLVARNVTWLRPFVFRARWPGKVVTVLQLATLAVVIVAPTKVLALVFLVGVTSAAAIADYTAALWRERAR